MQSFRRVLQLSAALTVAALLGATMPASSAPPSIKVGLVLPLTGNLAAFGASAEHGVEMAADAINAAGGIKSMGGAKLELVVRDSTSDPASAADATARLIDDSHPIAIIGAYASALSMTASSVAERRQVPFLTMSFTDELTSRGYKYLFQMVPKASTFGIKSVEYANEIAKAAHRPIKSFAVVYVDDPLGTTYEKGYRAAADAAHVPLKLSEPYPRSLTDASALAQKVMQSGADVLLPASYYTDAVLLTRSLKQSGAAMQIVGGSGGWLTPALYDALGQNTEGIIVIASSNYDTYGSFETQYLAKYKSFAPHEAFENAASLYVIAAALEASKSTTSQQLREAIAKVELHGGPVAGLPGGGVKFDATGLNIVAHPVMVQWRHGALLSVWPKTAHSSMPTWFGSPVR